MFQAFVANVEKDSIRFNNFSGDIQRATLNAHGEAWACELVNGISLPEEIASTERAMAFLEDFWKKIVALDRLRTPNTIGGKIAIAEISRDGEIKTSEMGPF
jgi:hypothetical protein